MAYTRFRDGFDITTSSAIDKRILMTKAEMLNAEELYNLPSQYFCICTDDNKLYLYDENNTATTALGKFILIDDKIDLPSAITKTMQSEAGKAAIEQAVGSTLPGAIAKSMESGESAQKIADAMFESDQFSVNVNNKIELKVSEAIQCIEAIDGMA